VATGSDTDAAPVFRESLHLGPDRPEEIQGAGVSVFMEVSRSSLSLFTVDVKSLKALAFRSFDFPYCGENTRWASTVARILNATETEGPTAVVLNNVSCSIIPSDLFKQEPESRNEILRLEHGELKGAGSVTATLEVWDAHCVAVIPDAILQLFPSARVLPSLFCWTPSLLRSPTAYHAHVHVSEREFSLAVLKGRDLVLHNDFTHQTPEDVLYFCMAALEQLAILHSEVRLSVYGNVTENDALHGLFRRYISHVVFGERPTELTYSYSFKELPGHRMPFILNAPICAS
jgi:hypothetical protein